MKHAAGDGVQAGVTHSPRDCSRSVLVSFGSTSPQQKLRHSGLCPGRGRVFLRSNGNQLLMTVDESDAVTKDDDYGEQSFSSNRFRTMCCSSTNMATYTKNNETMHSQEHEKFDLREVKASLEKCIGEDNLIDMDCYIRAYNELYRFMLLLGKVFKFVASDVIEKVTILEVHRKSGAGNHYATIQSMVAWEVSQGITTAKPSRGQPPSGCRTLLRLHRALVFLQKFMGQLADMPKDEKLSHMASEVYYDTLAHYHGWVVRKAFDVAVYMLPTRQHLLQQMCDQCESDQEMTALLHEIVSLIEPIYEETQRVFTANDLLDLP